MDGECRDTPRSKAIQANEIAGVVVDVLAASRPDMFVSLNTRYGIADVLWDLGYRKLNSAAPEF